jgi:MFS family permease
MSALRDARFRRLLAGEAVSGFGDSAMFLALAIWAKDLTGSAASAGLVFLFLTVPGLGAPLLGHLVDRVASRRMLLMLLNGGMALLLLTLLTVRTDGQLWLIYTVAFAYGVVFSTPVRGALLKDLLPSADAASARSLVIATRQGVRIVSPAIGAGVYTAWGGGTLAVLAAAMLAIAVGLLYSIRLRESAPEPAGEPFRRAVLGGFRHVRRVALLRRLVYAMIGLMAVVGLLETAVFAAVEDGLGRPAAFFGVLASLQGGGSLVGGLAAGWLVSRFGACRTSAAGYALMGTGMALCVAQSLPLFVAGVILNGAGLPMLAVALGTAEHLYTPARLQGRVGAAVGMGTDLAQSCSIAAGAVLIGVLDYRVMYALMAASGLVCAAAVLVRRPPVPAVVPSVADGPAGGDGDGAAARLASPAPG